VFSQDRHRRIVDAVSARGAASVRSLAEHLEVSESTIRRDLQELDRNGELVRTYGGAVAAAAPARRATEEAPYQVDSGANLALKQRVARAAAALVRDGDVAVLDIGTTTPLLARELRGRDVTVITSNLGVLDELRADEAVRLVLLGGVVRRNYQTLVGSLTERGLEQVNADVVFLSCTGVRPNGRVVDDMAVEVPVKQAMIEAADRVVLLATELKFPGSGSFRLCSLSDLHALVTTDGADQATTQLCRDAGGKVIIA
jgi:DeoR/GlpR family transcriptional regulator of sugar metabolism